ncbi:MAG: HlyC/CorC family transporter [Oceanococcus sp.]
MDEFPIGLLLGLLVALIAMSAFFSGSETALMALNRYRLQHQASSGDKAAQRVAALLKRQDRLIGIILLGNNFVNILASAIATIIGLRVFGESGIAIATGALTLVILIFAEVTPKTLAALDPERLAYPAAWVYTPLLKLLSPVVWLISAIARVLLRLLGVDPEDVSEHSLSTEELRTVVAETGAMIPRRHQHMLLSILDLEKATVEDIMVPRNEIVGVDISRDWAEVLEQIQNSHHTRLPLFYGSIDDIRGIIHLRRILGLLSTQTLNLENLSKQARDPYFIPEGTPLNQQLLNFQNQRRRIGFVVDEYGDIQGLVTLEDILEEIVGEFTTDPSTRERHATANPDGSYSVNAMTNVRSLNRAMSWALPSTGARTLNGLIVEQLEDIPEPGTHLKLNKYQVEIISTKANVIQQVKVTPPPSKSKPRRAQPSTI